MALQDQGNDRANGRVTAPLWDIPDASLRKKNLRSMLQGLPPFSDGSENLTRNERHRRQEILQKGPETALKAH